MHIAKPVSAGAPVSDIACKAAYEQTFRFAIDTGTIRTCLMDPS